MKNLIFIAVIIINFAFMACEEIPPSIDNSTSSDTTFISSVIPSADVKNVLIEEFTGVACLNCKDGHDEIDKLKETYGKRLIPIGSHAIDVFSDPGRISHSVPDLRSEDGLNAANLHGLPGSLPSAVIDRTNFIGEQETVVSLNKWAGFVAQRINESTPVNISISILSHDSINQNIIFEVEVTLTQTIEKELALSIALLEDKVSAPQLNGSVWLEDYLQPHVLRDYLTAYNGKSLNSNNISGRTYQFRFSEKYSSSWAPSEIELVAFVHYAGDDEKQYEVIQAVNTYL